MTDTEIQKLVERLQDQDREVRQEAAQALAGEAKLRTPGGNNGN